MWYTSIIKRHKTREPDMINSYIQITSIDMISNRKMYKTVSDTINSFSSLLWNVGSLPECVNLLAHQSKPRLRTATVRLKLGWEDAGTKRPIKS